jgi:hypothetical protein
VSPRCGVQTALVSVVLAFVLGVPALALAASTPAANGSIDVQAWPESGQLVVVVALTVPPSVQLPTTVRIPVPAKANIQWAGEVLGGDPNSDPARKYKIKKSPAGGSYAEFTVETTRSAQVDSLLPVVQTSGNAVSAAFDWIQSVSSPTTTISVRTPAKVSNVKITPAPSAAAQYDAAGEALYAGDLLTLTAGSTTKVSLSYSTESTSAATTSSSAQSKSLLYFVLAALVLAVAVLLIVLVRQRGSAASDAETASPRRASRSAEPKPTRSVRGDASEDDDDWGSVDED